MTHNLLNWEDALRRSGHRVTRQRGVILDGVCRSGGHVSLGEVYAHAQRVHPTLDRSTVYRALKLFIDIDLVVAADTGDGETYYEIKHTQQHHHLVCRTCGVEQEVDDTVLGVMFDQVKRQQGFQVKTDHLVLFGTCAACLAESEMPNEGHR